MVKYNDEIKFKKRCYELYQLDWIKNHEYSLQDVLNILRKGYLENWELEEIDATTHCNDDFDVLENYFKENGFNGEIFVTEQEFYNCEYLDYSYMETLLSKDMFKLYKKYQ